MAQSIIVFTSENLISILSRNNSQTDIPKIQMILAANFTSIIKFPGKIYIQSDKKNEEKEEFF